MNFDGAQAISIVKRALCREANELRGKREEQVSSYNIADLLDRVAEKISEEEYFSSLS